MKETMATSEWDAMAAPLVSRVFLLDKTIVNRSIREDERRGQRNVDMTDLAEQGLKAEYLFLKVSSLSY